MPQMIRRYDNANLPIIDGGHPLLSRTYFNLIRLAPGEEASYAIPGFESVCVVMSGRCDIAVDSEIFRDIGVRPDIWSGQADSVYVPTGAAVRIKAGAMRAEVAVAGGLCEKRFKPFRVSPTEVEPVEVGSTETKSHRTIYHVLGANAAGRAGNLLVSELLCEEGCWSGYPPHKHDERRLGEETAFEEVYHYRFRPDTGFGAQILYQPDGSSECYMTRSGDTVAIDRGFHPAVTSPGHEEYIFTILVGRDERSLVQHFDRAHARQMSRIPGIQAMRDAFK